MNSVSPEEISYPSQSGVFTARGVNFDRLEQATLYYNVVQGGEVVWNDEAPGMIVSATEIEFDTDTVPGEGQTWVVSSVIGYIDNSGEIEEIPLWPKG